MLVGVLVFLNNKGTIIEINTADPKRSQENQVLGGMPKNPPVSNSARDLTGANDLNAITLHWERDPRAVEYVLFRRDSLEGSFVEVSRLPAGLQFPTNAQDVTPDARTKTLCYRLEAIGTQGELVRVYEAVCVEQYNVASRSHELFGLEKRTQPDTMCIRDNLFIDAGRMSEEEIRNFLASRNSFLKDPLLDVDNVLTNPAREIFQAAVFFEINPQVILATMEKEQRAVTS